MRKHGVSDGSGGNSALTVAAERTPGAETARSRSRACSCCRVCWSLPGMIGRGASCADTAIGISHAADSSTTGVRIVIDAVLLVRFYGLGARCPGIHTHSVPLHFQKPITQIVLDHDGNTGSISGLGGGRGGASGGTVSHAARSVEMTNDRAKGHLTFFIVASMSATSTDQVLNHRKTRPISPRGGGTQPGFRKS